MDESEEAMTKSRATILAVAGLAGCVSAQTFRSGTGRVYARTRPDDELVFYSVEDVKRLLRSDRGDHDGGEHGVPAQRG